MTDSPAVETRSAYWKGIGLALAADLLVPWAAWTAAWLIGYPFQRFGMHRVLDALMPVAAFLFLGIGASQWLWLVPLSRRFKNRGEVEKAKGVVSGGWIVFLLNAGCWGLFGLLIGGRTAG